LCEWTLRLVLRPSLALAIPPTIIKEYTRRIVSSDSQAVTVQSATAYGTY
jgi:hypothetical protein